MKCPIAAARVSAVATQQLAEQRAQVEPAAGEDTEIAMEGQNRVVGRSAAATPTAMASCPMPENHFDSRPCRNRINIFSSTRRGKSSARYRLPLSLGVDGAIDRGDGPGWQCDARGG